MSVHRTYAWPGHSVISSVRFLSRRKFSPKIISLIILERATRIDRSIPPRAQDVLFGRTPQNVMLYGKAGLGKTAVTTYMMEALQDEVTKRPDADDVHVHELNCNESLSTLSFALWSTDCYPSMQASSRNVVLERLTPSRNSTLNLTESAELTSSSSTRLITWTMSTPSCMNSRERDRSVTSRTRRSESSESVTTTRFGSRSRRR